MVDTTDVQGYGTKYDNQMERLDEADIDEADREAIRQFVVHLRANSDNNKGTIVNNLNHLRLCSERARLPLTEMTKGDVDELVVDLEDKHGLSPRTVRNYRKSLRKFFKWYDGADFGEDVKVGSPIHEKKDPDEALTDDEVQNLLDAAKNARDKALIAILDDTGVRIGAALSFQMKHVKLDGPRATLTINERAHVKGDSGEKPITWSRGYIANWLDMHPRPDEPEAALIHKTKQWGPDEHGALAQQYAGRRISETAERAGLDPDRVEARLFRSTAITRWMLDEFSDQAIKHRTGWGKDSRMFEIYERVRDREMNDVIFDHYDIEGGDEDEAARRTHIEQCPSCRTPLREVARFCPGCGLPLSSTAASAADEVEDETFESMGNAQGSTEAFITEFRRRWKQDPEFRERMVGDGGVDHDDPSSS